MPRIIGFVFLLTAGILTAADPYYSIDFKDGVVPSNIKPNTSEVTLSVLPDGSLMCENSSPARFSGFYGELKLDYAPDMMVTLEYRNEVPKGVKLTYTGFNVHTEQKLSCFTSLPVSAEWTTATVKLSRLVYSQTRKQMKPGAKIVKFILYNRILNSDPKAMTKLFVRSVKIEKDPDHDTRAEAENVQASIRTSYSAIPFMNWSKSKDAEKYTIEFSKDSSFPANATKTYETARNFLSVASGLEDLYPGLLHYRVKSLPEGKILEDNVINIPEQHHKWIVPEYDWAKVAAMPHPRLKNLALFYNPDKAPSFSNMAEYMPPPDPGPYVEGANPEIRAWIEWYGKIAGGVISKCGGRMTSLGQAAILNNDRQLMETARKSLLFIARNWDPNGGSHVSKCDLQTGNLLIGLCWCYDAAYNIMAPEERKIARDCLLERGGQFWKWSNPFRGNEAQNHPWDRVQKVAFVALTLAELPEMKEWFDFAAQLYAYRFIACLGFQGENNEGLAYWSFGVGLLIRFVDIARHVAGADFYTHPWLARTARFPMYCAPANGYSVSFADSGKPNHSIKGPVNSSFTGKLASEAGDPEALWYAGFAETNGLAAKCPVESEYSVFYKHLGIAVFNTFLPDARENVALGFHSGKFFAGHQHKDQNSFVINAYGDKLAVDGGYYDWYGSKHFKAYSINSIAHNTILLNGKGQEGMRNGCDGNVEAWKDTAAFGYVSGRADKIALYGKNMKLFRRQILFVKPDYVIVYDRLETEKPSTFSWLIHSHTDKPISTKGKEFCIERPLARLDGTMLLPDNARIEVKEAYDEPAVAGYSVDPVKDPQPEWTLWAENPAQEKNMEFLAVMRISKSCWYQQTKDEFEVLRGEGCVGVRCQSFAAVFSDTGNVELGGFSGKARAAAVRLKKNGEVEDAMVVGESLTYKGKDVTAGFGKETPVIEKIDSSITLDGYKFPCEGRAVALPGGRKVYSYNSIVDLSDGGRYKIEMGHKLGEDGPPYLINLRMFQNGKSDTMSWVYGHITKPVLFASGKTVLYICSEEPLKNLNLKRMLGKVLPAIEHPGDYALPSDSIVHEAENILNQGGERKARIVERESATDGKATAGWDVGGQFGEWEIHIPSDGDYRLLIRTATSKHPRIIRGITLDGKAIDDACQGVSWGETGGFGYAPKEWRWMEVPVTAKLAKGRHILTIEVDMGSSNLDTFAFVPVKITKNGE